MLEREQGQVGLFQIIPYTSNSLHLGYLVLAAPFKALALGAVLVLYYWVEFEKLENQVVAFYMALCLMVEAVFIILLYTRLKSYWANGLLPQTETVALTLTIVFTGLLIAVAIVVAAFVIL